MILKKIAVAYVFCFTFGAISQINHAQKLTEVSTYIDRLYVDEVDNDEITDAAIVAMLEKLDPHSTYIPKEEVESANERINGSFVGIGIRFQILKDTLLVVNPIPGGPSEKLGIRAGDKIIKIEEELVAGTGLKNSGVRERLLGDLGSKVNVSIKRKGVAKLLDFSITRDKIPVNSVVSTYMLDEEVGYIKLTSFSRTSEQEIRDALVELKRQGMNDLIFDLEGNGGGLLYAAKSIADEFLSGDKLIVYSEGKAQPRRDLNADTKGKFEKGRLVILIDEGTASASEIVSGAVQDWDRGLIVGRRTFGKGLVQRPIELSDGSQIRLTIARYFTPSGRFIQKPYDDLEAYKNDYLDRYLSGQMTSEDSVSVNDSLKFKTLNKKRVVYGGGGIMPDVFVPLDTTEFSEYYRKISRSGLINQFAIDYVNNNRAVFKTSYATFENFKLSFVVDQALIDQFLAYVVQENAGLSFNQEEFDICKDLFSVRLKATIAQNYWDYSSFYEIYNVKNEIVMEAYNILKLDEYKKMNLAK